MKKIKRTCAICGKDLNIELDIDNPTEEGKYPYTGGHYWGNLFDGTHIKAEYWECDECYNESDPGE